MAGRTSQASRRGADLTPRQSAALARQRVRDRTRTARRHTATTSLGYLGAAIIGLWMGIAHLVGWVARLLGRQAATARELDPEHRRDGGGLFPVAIAIVLAVAVWCGSAGPVGHWLAVGTRYSIGAIAVALPVLVLVGALRLMRAPRETAPRPG